MTKTTHKLLLATAIIAIGAIMLSSTMMTEAEAKTKTFQQKINGDSLGAWASNWPVSYASVNVQQIANSNDVNLWYNSNVGDGFCIADKSVLKGSGTNTLSVNADTTGFTVLPVGNWPSQAGECAWWTSGLGVVSATVTRDGQWSSSSSGSNTWCSISGGIEFCQKSNGHTDFGSASIDAGNVLGIDLTLIPNQSASAGKQNTVTQSWTNP
ncbi:hypothetical protein [Nitrosopumilus sp. S4]